MKESVSMGQIDTAKGKLIILLLGNEIGLVRLSIYCLK